MSKKKHIGVEYHDHGTHITVSVDGSLIRCVSCNRPLEHSKETKKANHHCPPSHEAAAVASKHHHAELGEYRTPSWAQRIAEGYRMMEIYSS